MNSPEKIAGVYLRLNGFFLMPQFTLFDGKRHTHIDFLGLRAPQSIEMCGNLAFPLDDGLFNLLDEQVEGDSRNQLLAVITEVKGNKKKEKPGEGHIEYIDHFIGSANRIKIFFRNQGVEVSRSDDVIEIPLGYSLNWIIRRIDWIDENQEGLAKKSS